MRHREVVVVNGFAQPVQATIGPALLEVPAGQHRRVSVPTGTLIARAATTAGRVVDEGPLEIGRGTDLLVWNVGGVAPVMEREVLYTTESASDGSAEEELRILRAAHPDAEAAEPAPPSHPRP